MLVVDHNPWLRHALSTALEHVGATVAEASNGASAMRKAVADPPHLVILGPELPEIGVVDVIDGMRSDPRTRHTAIIGVHGDAEFDASLSVPFGSVDVLAAVVEALEVRRQALAGTPMRSVSASAFGARPLLESGAARSTSSTRKAGRSTKWRFSRGIETL